MERITEEAENCLDHDQVRIFMSLSVLVLTFSPIMYLQPKITYITVSII